MSSDPLVTDALLLTRWAHFTCLALLFGAPLFWLFAPGIFRARQQTWRMLRFAAPLAVLSGVGWLWAIFANIVGGFEATLDPENLSLFFLQTPFGVTAAARLLLLAALLVVARTKPRFAAVMVLAALLIVDQAWLGHAAEGSGAHGALMIGVYIVHVGAAFAWLGGLPPLLLAMREARPEPRRCVEALRRFSIAALVFVVLIVASGAGNAAFHVGAAFAKLPHSAYGAALAAKAALTCAMLALAGFNRFVALPRLRATGESRTLTLLVRSIALECALGLGVLAAAAVLGVTPPPQ